MRIAKAVPFAALAAAAAITGLATPAHADPFDHRHVPADSKWVVHVDVDAARTTSVGHVINDRLNQLPDFQTKVAQVSVITGMTYPRDLHDVTLYGRASGDEAVVVIAHAHMDRQRILTAVSTTPDHAIHHVGDYDVIRWSDNGKTMFGAFHDDDTIVVARSEANVSAALDTIDGKAPATAADGPLAGTAPAATRPAVGAADHPALFVALADLPSLIRAGAEVPAPLRQVDGGCLALSEARGSVTVRANLTATTADAADQLRTAAEGLRAMLAFAAAGADADPKVKSASDLLRTATLGRTDRTVTIDLTVPAKEVCEAIRSMGMNATAHAEDVGKSDEGGSVKTKVDADGDAK